MVEATLRGAKNNVATQVKIVEPWTFVPNVPATIKEKKEYAVWRSDPATEHLVFSGYEGTNPDIRINTKTNPIKRMHAVVADFDYRASDKDCETVLQRCPADLRPTWIARSFSGGARLVYMFETPLPLEVGALTAEFLKVVTRELKLASVLGSLDVNAFNDPSKYYDVGRDWKKLGDYTLSTNVLNFWLTEAAKKTRWDKLGEVMISIDKVADEVERQFPGRWQGPFEVGRRGCVFFHQGAENPTSAIVTEAGMICFSTDKRFYPWAEIFGGSFVRQYQADRIGSAVADVWFDGRVYYRKIEGRWVHVAKEDFVKFLNSDRRLSSERRGNTASETTDAEVFLHKTRRIHGAIPALFDPRDVIERDGQKYLNIAYVRAAQPADQGGEWGELFPWHANFFDTFFDPPLQKDIFLAWWKRLYMTALAGDLQRGQNVFLVGPVDIGKTLLGRKIIGASVGGSADASDYVARASQFNKKLGETALWTIDDGQLSSDPVVHRKFGEMVKKLAANPTINFRKMYADAETEEWAGRLFVTLNNDDYSLQMIPDLSISLEDKVLIFNVADVARAFPPKPQLEATILAEQPYILRWLLDWAPPARVLADNRFGIARYIHEGLRTAALYSGQVGDLLELINLWIKRARPIERHPSGRWNGSASEWLAELNSNDDHGMRSMVNKFTAKSLGRKFIDAARIPGSRVSVLKKDTHGNFYSINLLDVPNGQPSPVKITPEVLTEQPAAQSV